MARPGIMLYFDILGAAKLLPLEDCGRLLLAMLEYGKYGSVPHFEGPLAMAWEFVKPKIDKDEEEYNLLVQRRQYATICRERKKRGEPEITFDDWVKSQEAADHHNAPLMTNDHHDASLMTNDNQWYPTTTTATSTTTTTTPSTTTTASADGKDTAATPKRNNRGPNTVPVGEIVELYNTLCPSLPKCGMLADLTRIAICDRWGEYGSLDTFRELFRKAQASSFLTGKKNNSWRANLDWLMGQSNMAKTLNGNFENASGRRELDQEEAAAIRRMLEEDGE